MASALANKIENKILSFDPAVKSLFELYDRVQKPDTPKDVMESIERTLEILNKKDEYCVKNTVPDTPNARMIHDKTMSTPWKKLHEEGKAPINFNPLMQSCTGQGQFLQFLIRMQKAKRALEIGTFTGYGAMAMAEALPQDGAVVTLELEPFLVDMARQNFDGTPFGKKIDIRQGPATESLAKLASEGQKFDIVYLDCDKPNYSAYYKAVMDQGLLAAGGTLVIDNAFQFGKTFLDPSSPVDDLHKIIMADSRVEQVLLPMFDGMSLLRRKGE